MKKSLVGLVLITCLVAAAPLVAHHSFSAEFDSTKPKSLKGWVTKIDWTNPHVWIYMNVKDEKGVMANWGFEMGPPHLLQGQGWTRTTQPMGAACAHRATANTPRSLSLVDGTQHADVCRWTS